MGKLFPSAGNMQEPSLDGRSAPATDLDAAYFRYILNIPRDRAETIPNGFQITQTSQPAIQVVKSTDITSLVI